MKDATETQSETITAAEYLRRRHRELCSGLDFTDYGDHLVNPRSGTCPLCGGTAGGCRC